ncbi:MAG TPA: TetR/AcrR family transcriptional regulator [Myxococcota bacterium]|nr:TetR/AcrR family transcriptional regulator [Myxococcota bacterium]
MKPARRDSDRDAQRGRIVDAALALFGSRGFDAVTMTEVAEQAGVARATVFNHFGSKHALVEAIIEGVLAYWAGMLERALADEKTSTPTLVRALFDHMGSGIEQFHGFYRGVFREIVKIQVGLEEGGEAARARERALERLERLLARGQERGELAGAVGPTDLACAFDSLANGTITHWLYDDTSGSLRERMGRAAEVFLGRVAAAGDRSEPLPDLSVPTAWISRHRPTPLPRARARRKR